MTNRNCVHGNLVNDTCVCDLLWQGESCQQRDCQAGQFRDGICVCHLRHAGEFCEYHACYHKDVLYCWGLKDVEFLPCNASAARTIDPATVRNPAWYCPCNEGRRTPPPYTHCVCNDGYTGEFCGTKICESVNGVCPDSVYGPYNTGTSSGIVVPDSVKVAMVCMSMVVLVAFVVWLRRVCFRHQQSRDEAELPREPGADLRAQRGRHHLTPAQLSATLLMLQARHNYQCDWDRPPGTTGQGRRAIGIGPSQNPRPAPLPSYDEANSAPPSYNSVLAMKKPSTAKVTSRKGSTVVDAEAGQASNVNSGQHRPNTDGCSLKKETAGRRRSL